MVIALKSGFAGWIDNGIFSNIVLNNIENISGNHVGGFAGEIANGTLSNIVLNNIGDIGGNYQANEWLAWDSG